ncbi:peptidoglycan editing factor PgeF [Pusillimonas sp. MFBS29]|uniref:peptidoglycan editing factor PgeF n=1 Tax=Pusillimonas sp. MFBS29 TaxID=2886690 RepID=UPI001D121C58|nr:peptidoglycan editing factor PgeF [Pusillimonas sp. MFBS29]MCC2596459.1 peptidoglycan editing factor PgeF [Pusillimonas sp. MFBS29]
MEHLNEAALPTVTGEPWHGVRYFCTTRQGGCSAGPWASLNLGTHVGDDGAAVSSNRQRLSALLPGEPVWLTQVHGVDVLDADQLEAEVRSGGAPTADAAVTLQANRVLAIMTADCLPVVLASANGRALGVAHAGWRGLADGVLENTLQALRERAPGNVSWRAWIGPAIGPASFEVGDDVHAAFVDKDPDAAPFFVPKAEQGKWLADLPGLARLRLRKAGVGTIELSNACTFNQAETYFSYRRDGVTGRMVTLAWLVDQDRCKPDSDLP